MNGGAGDPKAEAARRRRGRSIAILAVLLALVGLFYAISVARISTGLGQRSPAPAQVRS